MSLDVVIGVVGVLVTILVVAGMILMTPRGLQSSRPPADSPGVEDEPPTPTTSSARLTTPAR